jgi:polar amino acid transport system substrate-binding protein
MQTAPSPEIGAALTPTGKVRVAFVSTSIYATKDAKSGELRGVAIDLGTDLARRLGVPFEPVVYSNVTTLLAGAKAGELDVAFMGINAERAMALDFSSPYMEVELGYLARAGSPIASISDVDRPGVRIGVLDKGGSDLHLSRTLKNAEVVRAPNALELYSLVKAAKVDVVAATKTALYVEADKLPGTRVLDGRFLVEPIGAGVPKGRNAAAAAYIANFVEMEKANGQVKSAIDRAGLRGVVVAPPK